MYLAHYESQLYADFLEYRLYKWIHWAASPLLLIAGSLGNSLLIWLLLPNCRTTPTYQYLVVLGLVDQLVLTSGLLNSWLRQFFGFNLEVVCSACCPLNKFISYFSSYFSALLIIVVSVERALVVCFPLKAASLQSAKRIRLVIAGIMGFSCLINSYWFFILDRVSNQSSNVTVGYMHCDINASKKYLSGPISVLDAVLYSILPLVVIFSCNIVTICKLRQAGHNRRDRLNASRQQESHQPVTAAQENVRQVTILLLSISTFYLIASLPVALLKVLTTLSNAVDVAAINEDVHSYARYRLVESVTNLFMFSNHAVNFLLYCASGQRIRNELRARMKHACRTCCFCCCCCCFFCCCSCCDRETPESRSSTGRSVTAGSTVVVVEYAKLRQSAHGRPKEAAVLVGSVRKPVNWRDGDN